MNKLEYRREIDGLRSLAVLAVVIYHADFMLFGNRLFSGGYLGVDIFFVISGYLISAILIREAGENGVSLLDFYKRRIRRIIPALLFVLLFSLPFFWGLLPEEEFKKVALSAFAAIFSVSNFYFLLQEGDYWATANELTPFLHTWTLGVEEQFYFFIPLLIAALAKKNTKMLIPVFAVLAVVSFAIAIAGQKNHPSFTFYMLPARAWELLVGCLLAAAEARWGRTTTNRKIASCILALSVLALVVSILVISGGANYSPALTGIVVLSTAIFIWFSGGQDIVSRIFSSSVPVFIGLISYSLYLWHFPIFVMARYTGDFTSVVSKLACIILAFLMALMSYHLIERPFRGTRIAFRSVFASVVGALAVISLFTFFGVTRYAAKVPATEIETANDISVEQSRFRQPRFDQIVPRNCVELIPQAEKTICRIYGDEKARLAIWGDSHAGAYHALSKYEEVPSHIIIRHPGCPPVSGVIRADVGALSINCNQFEQLRYYEDYLIEQDVEVVALVARWSMYTNGFHRNNAIMTGHSFVTDDIMKDLNPENSTESLKQYLIAMIKRFEAAGIRVLFIEQPPDFQAFSPIESVRSGAPADTVLSWHEREVDIVKAVTTATFISAIQYRDIICDSEFCYPLSPEGERLYRDDNHLSELGASPIFQMIAQKF